MDQTTPERVTMTTMTGSASPLSEARWPATPTQVHLADPLLDALIHDIRTPLAAISAHAQLLPRRTATGKQEAAGLAEGLRQVEQAAPRAGHLLDELSWPCPVVRRTREQPPTGD